MQNETLRGDSPAAARGASARNVRLCVACLHENRHGEPSCEECGTSLFLLLCPTCEAANGTDAVHCHSCGTALGVEADDKPAVAPPAPASQPSPERTEASEEPETAPPAGRMSLVRTEASDNRAPAPQARGTSRGRLALMLAGAVVTTAAVTYYFSARTAQADRAPQGKVVEVAPVKSVEPTGGVPPPRPANQYVTHTQPAEASQAAPSAPVARAAVIEVAPVKSVAPAKSVEPPRRVPPPRTEPKVAAPIADPANSAHSHVTHTRRADVGQAAPAVAAPAAAVAVAAPAAGQKSDSGCGEAIAALGLCNSRAQSGGK